MLKRCTLFTYNSFVLEDTIPIDRGRDRGRLSDNSTTDPYLIHSSIIRQSQTNSEKYYYYYHY